jgi:transcriptional regulator with XRE-family HTH domain
MAQGEGAGERIAQAMTAAGLSQAEVSRRLKVSQPTVNGWLNQRHGITWKNVRRVAALLKVAPGWIMFGADEEAERVAHTAEELAFLRLFRELDDTDHPPVLRLLTNMQHPPSGTPKAPRRHNPPPEPDDPPAKRRTLSGKHNGEDRRVNPR